MGFNRVQCILDWAGGTKVEGYFRPRDFRQSSTFNTPCELLWQSQIKNHVIPGHLHRLLSLCFAPVWTDPQVLDDITACEQYELCHIHIQTHFDPAEVGKSLATSVPTKQELVSGDIWK